MLLLALTDSTAHNRAKYVLAGPEDITGAQIVRLVEKPFGIKVKDAVFQDISFLDALIANRYRGPGQSKTVMRCIEYGIMTMWGGLCTTATISKEVKEIKALERTSSEMLDYLLEA